jgi:hypothetical protein
MIQKYVGDLFSLYQIFRVTVLTSLARFQILYNRQRQATITGELVEIITGATASEDM